MKVNPLSTILVGVIIGAPSVISAHNLQTSELVLAVADSTCTPMQRVSKLFNRQTGIHVITICKSSGRLAKGLRGKAIKADFYVSANRAWMDYLIKAGLVEPDKVSSPWTNSLIVAVPRNSGISLNSLSDLASPQIRKIIIGDPGTAPFGRYAKQALQTVGAWNRVREKISIKKHITLAAQAISVAKPGTVGILFSTNVGKSLRTALRIPVNLHAPIRYYAGPLSASADRAEVGAFSQFLTTPATKQIFATAGFGR
jgi:molybdate transport system substrate-binding protein